MIFLLACTASKESAADSALVLPPGEELELPEGIEEIDFEAAFTEALSVVLLINPQKPWAAHLAALEGIEADCPDFYTGPPELEEELGFDENQLVWYDTCITQSGQSYSGALGWQNSLVVSGDISASEGLTSDGYRQLVGDATVASPSEVLFEFDGEASDALSLSEGPLGTHWSYSSSVVGTVSGGLVDEVRVAGWRTDLYLSRTGGDYNSIEARGNLFYFEDRLNEQFDSLAMDIGMTGPESVAPEECGLEPAGWMGIRDPDAFWYDLVFGPRYPEETGESPGVCDGCGILYVRGIEQPQLTICLDFSLLWQEEPPETPESYAFSARELLMEEE
jgi:hypothetical protein